MNFRSVAPVALTAAVIGGGVGAGTAAIVGTGTKEVKTVVQQAPISSGSVHEAAQSGLTARDIYKRDAPGVVYIRADVVQQSQASPFDFGLPQQQQGTSTGSGFVLDKNGYIITNAHVIDGAVKVTVQLADKQTVDARIIGKDTSSDIAVLKVDPDGLNLSPLQLGSAKDVQVGDPVIAIGNPFGLDRTLTTGVVSALQRRITAPNNYSIDNVIQTDAAINPGNSGGPLIDSTGKVIGINSQIETGGNGNGNVGIGFAIPIDTAQKIIPQLEKNGKVQHAYLGVSTLTIDSSLSQLNLPSKSGALVQSVQRGSPAAGKLRAGEFSGQLGGQEITIGGDIITALDGKPVKTSDDLANMVASHKVGDTVKITIIRAGKKQDVDVKLGSRPNTTIEEG